MNLIKRPILINIWEAPRSKGTCISFAIHNGLRSLGYKGEFWDEPFHSKRLKEFDSPQKKNDYLNKIKNPKKLSCDYIIQKHQAKQIFKINAKPNKKDIDWIKEFKNIILIRDTSELIFSHYNIVQKKSSNDSGILDFERLGIKQLFSLFKFLSSAEIILPFWVIDSNELLANPTKGMRKMCSLLEIPFSRNMVIWDKCDIDIPPYGDSWYRKLYDSKGLKIYTHKKVNLKKDLVFLNKRAETYYEKLRRIKTNILAVSN